MWFCGAYGNVPVPAELPALTCESCPPASDDPRPSTIMIQGRCCRNSSLRLEESAAPPDRIIPSDERSRVLFARPSMSGRPKASPTMRRNDAFSLSTVFQTSSASSRSGCDCTMTVPPDNHVRIAIQWLAPCINGGLVNDRKPTFASARNSSTVCAVLEPPKHSTTASALRHRTPLGIPVVPPVYKM